MEQQRLVGNTTTDDVVVTAVLEAKLLAQRVGREDVVAGEDVRARAGTLNLFCARIDAQHLPPATGES